MTKAACVTVARLHDMEAALVARSVLQAAGIPAFIPEEGLARVAWHYTTALGGVRLMVPARAAEEARTLLEPVPVEPATVEARPRRVLPLWGWPLALVLGAVLTLEAATAVLRWRR